MRKLVDDALTDAEIQTVREQDNSLIDLSDLSDIHFKKTTAVDGKISGYVTAIRTGQFLNMVMVDKAEPQLDEVDNVISEILDISTDMIEEKDSPVTIKNLLSSLNSELENLWELRHIREREFAKFIILIQAITKGESGANYSGEQIECLATILQTLKIPKICDIDIKKCTKLMEGAGLNIYKPLIKNPKVKIIIQQEE
jgi:hypothetical protein